MVSLWSGLSLHPRTGHAAVRVPAVKSLHLLSSENRLESLARDYRATGFPEFDRLSRRSFLLRSPLQNLVPSVPVYGRTRLSLTLVSFNQVNFTGVADEHINWENVEQIPVRKICQGKIKIRRGIDLSKHHPSICLGSSRSEERRVGKSVDLGGRR